MKLEAEARRFGPVVEAKGDTPAWGAGVQMAVNFLIVSRSRVGKPPLSVGFHRGLIPFSRFSFGSVAQCSECVGQN